MLVLSDIRSAIQAGLVMQSFGDCKGCSMLFGNLLLIPYIIYYLSKFDKKQGLVSMPGELYKAQSYGLIHLHMPLMACEGYAACFLFTK